MANYQVVCLGPCGTQLYEGDDPPPTPARQMLRQFADTQCPIGGTANGCPNTAAAQDDADDARPDRLRQVIKAAQARLSRSRSLVLPALVANTPQEIPITWPTAMPDATYRVTIGQEFAQPVLLGAIRAVVKAGSRTTDGCTLLVGSTRDVADGAAGLHVVATP